MCRKKKYSTLKFANRVLLKRIKQSGDSLRVYYCNACKSYHLTSMDLDSWEENRDAKNNRVDDHHEKQRKNQRKNLQDI